MTSTPPPPPNSPTHENKVLWSGSFDEYGREAEKQWQESLKFMMHRAQGGNKEAVEFLQGILCTIRKDCNPVLWSELRASVEKSPHLFGFDGTNWRWIFEDENPQVVDATNFVRQQMTGTGPWVINFEFDKLTKPQGTSEKRPREFQENENLTTCPKHHL